MEKNEKKWKKEKKKKKQMEQNVAELKILVFRLGPDPLSLSWF